MEVGVWEGKKYPVSVDQGPGKENLELPGESSCRNEGEGMENEGECVQEEGVTRGGKGAGNSKSLEAGNGGLEALVPALLYRESPPALATSPRERASGKQHVASNGVRGA